MPEQWGRSPGSFQPRSGTPSHACSWTGWEQRGPSASSQEKGQAGGGTSTPLWVTPEATKCCQAPRGHVPWAQKGGKDLGRAQAGCHRCTSGTGRCRRPLPRGQRAQEALLGPQRPPGARLLHTTEPREPRERFTRTHRSEHSPW